MKYIRKLIVNIKQYFINLNAYLNKNKEDYDRRVKAIKGPWLDDKTLELIRDPFTSKQILENIHKPQDQRVPIIDKDGTKYELITVRPKNY